eukprot:Awhi_evm1s7698
MTQENKDCCICLKPIGFTHKEMKTGCPHHYHCSCMNKVNLSTDKSKFSCPMCQDHEILHPRFEFDGHQCCDIEYDF